MKEERRSGTVYYTHMLLRVYHQTHGISDVVVVVEMPLLLITESARVNKQRIYTCKGKEIDYSSRSACTCLRQIAPFNPCVCVRDLQSSIFRSVQRGERRERGVEVSLPIFPMTG